MQQSSGLVRCKFCKQRFPLNQMYCHQLECNINNHPEYESKIQQSQIDPQVQSQINSQIQSQIIVPQQPNPSNIRPHSRFIPAQQNFNQQQPQQSDILYKSNKQEVPLQQEPSQYTESLIQKTVQKCEYCQEDFPKDSILEHYNVCESLKSLQQFQDDAFNEDQLEEPQEQSQFQNRYTEQLEQDGLIRTTSVQENPLTGVRSETIQIIDPRTGARQTISTIQRRSHNGAQYPPQPQPPQSSIFPQPPPFANFQDMPPGFPFPGHLQRSGFNPFRSSRSSLLDRFFIDLFGGPRYEEIQDHLTVIIYAPYDSLSDEYKQCNICFSEYQDGEELILLPCLHRFHKECIKKWFEEQLTCPICKLDIRRELMPFEGELGDDDDI